MIDFSLGKGGNVLGIGTDLIDVSRIKDACENHQERFIKRIFTKDEIHYCQKKRNPYPYFAARFAAKEAVSKAFSTGIGPYLDWTSIEVAKGKRDEPIIILDNKAQNLLSELSGSKVLISITHTQLLAQAFAVIIA